MTFVERVCEALQREKVGYALVGGYAVALHGAVRGTIDVDLVLRHRESDFVGAERALTKLGLVPRLPVTASEVFQFRKEYVTRRNLVGWSFQNPHRPLEQVDIIISYDLSHGKVVRVHGRTGKISILDIDDLIEMKRASGRPQDLEDVKALEALKR